jgi:hypothetical protein
MSTTSGGVGFPLNRYPLLAQGLGAQSFSVAGGPPALLYGNGCPPRPNNPCSLLCAQVWSLGIDVSRYSSPRYALSLAPALLLPSYFLSTGSVGMNVLVGCHSLHWCRSLVLRCDAGMVWKGLALRSPFHRKRKPSMGLSFQDLSNSPDHRAIGNVFCGVCASVISQLSKSVKRWTTIGRSLRLFFIWTPSRQRNHEVLSAEPRKIVNETTI